MTFQDLNIEADMVQALADRGILEPFPIQQQTIPLALSGQDIIGQAKTGTGKTFAFGLPLSQRLGATPGPGVQALIVVPTRELAVQVTEDMELITSNRPTTVVSIYGGKAYEGQIDQLKAGAQIVVGTPGRLLDLVQQRILDLGGVKEMVLDEADRMLDLGFLPDVEKLFSKVPEVRHTMLFSATMPGAIVALARRFMSRPLHIRAAGVDETIAQANIEHIVYRAHSLDKDEVVSRILQAEGRGKAVVFTRTKRAASRLTEELIDRGFNAAAVHGDMSQEARERAMAQFKAGKKDVLIATDVAARGIDVDDITHVINHTLPEDEKAYLHRVGRTGRAGRTGIAVTFVDWDDLHKWALIDRALEFNRPEPVETYSSSPHLYSDLNIPEGVKGRLTTTPPNKEAKREGVAPGARGERGGRSSGRSGERTSEHSSERTEGEGRRRRSRGGRGRSGGGSGEGHSADASTQSRDQQSGGEQTGGQQVEGRGTHDGGGNEHHDGNAAPRRRRRRRSGGGGGGGANAPQAPQA
ncbi:Superfamily II DNA and RNA helicase [Agrococcus baldri]|uniref:Superfamily II DNA and RNA helicase n=1 Tax=Agrococcus baldri TaxID=153730 RepID=A0AA94L064_9MICO|nr:DEAD/DEAH box helicase [Agrococcus baldri]SFS15462.1 Superfamily II DNA and RNA helicase [Agrococcus baldri]